MQTATNQDVERIATRLMTYIKTACMSDDTIKIAICEALYEMQAIASGETFEPVITVVGS